MRVLLTNHRMEHWGGSEAYLRDIAGALVRRGHRPIIYSRVLGSAAEDLRRLGVAVVRDPALVGEPPDLIHGQHHLPTMEALLHFPGVPAVSFCHGWLPWEELPPRFPRIVRYVTVSALVRERLVSEHGIAPEAVDVIPNFVDLARFAPRTEPLPARPRRALVFSNQAVPGEGFHRAIAAACARRGIEVEVVGFGSGRNVEHPEELLAGFDVVFARGRCALEAMAVGCAVILCDTEGLGPVVTVDQMEDLAAANFGLGSLRDEVHPDLVSARLDHYDPGEAVAVRAWVRGHVGLEATMDRIVAVYERALEEWTRLAPGYDPSFEPAAVSAYLAILQTSVMPQMIREARHAESDPLRERSQGLEAEVASLEGRVAGLDAEMARLEASRAVRLQHWLRAHPRLAGLYRAAMRLFSPR